MADRSVSLSIIDATVANFASTEVILFYNSTSSQDQTQTFIQHLSQGLEATLDAYPQWGGRLHRSSYSPKSLDHAQRYGRLVLTFGSDDDPGVYFTVVRTSTSLSDFVPSLRERLTDSKTWNATGLPAGNFTPKEKLSTDDLDDPSLSSIAVRVTIFACGGLAIALKFAHPLADAKCMSNFTKHWAAATSASITGGPTPPMTPVFNPQLLDDCAAGEIDGLAPYPMITKKARELPCHRFDW
jgi:hypothetical protein